MNSKIFSEVKQEVKKWHKTHKIYRLNEVHNVHPDFCIVEHFDTDDMCMKYTKVDRYGVMGNMEYSDYDKCLVASVLNLGINDGRTLDMIMSVQ